MTYQTRRGDPLVWPGALSMRLALLGVLATFTTLLSGATLGSLKYDPGAADAGLDRSAACLDAMMQRMTGPEGLREGEVYDTVVGCLAGLESIFVLAPLLLLAATAVLAVAFYALMPAWKRHGLRLDAQTPPAALISWVNKTLADEDLAGRVRVRWFLLDPRPLAFAYGAFGRYEVALSGGILGLGLADRAQAIAVLRHELAHIRHGDVDAFCIARAILWAFLVAVAAPTVILSPWFARFGPDGLAIELVGQAVEIAAVVVTLIVARNLLLHEIEHRADLASGAEDVADDGIAARLLPWWLLHHPPAYRRSEVLQRPLELLRVRGVEFVLLGIAVGLALPVLIVLTGLVFLLILGQGGVEAWAGGTPGAVATAMLPGSLIGATLAAILTNFVWRDRLFTRLEGAASRSSLAVAALLLAGVVAGLAVSPVLGLGAVLEHRNLFIANTLGEIPPIAPAVLAATALTTLVYVLAILTFCAAWLRYVADCWSAAVLEPPSPRRVVQGATVLGAVVLGPLLASLLYAIFLGAAVAMAGQSPRPAAGVLVTVLGAAGSLLANPLALVSAMLLGAAPFLAARAEGASARSRLLGEGTAVACRDARLSRSTLAVVALVLAAALWVLYRTPLVARQAVALGGEPVGVYYVFILFGAAIVLALALAAALCAPRASWAHACVTAALGGLGLGAMQLWSFGSGPDDAFGALLGSNAAAWLSLVLASAGLCLVVRVWQRRARTGFTLGARRGGAGPWPAPAGRTVKPAEDRGAARRSWTWRRGAVAGLAVLLLAATLHDERSAEPGGEALRASAPPDAKDAALVAERLGRIDVDLDWLRRRQPGWRIDVNALIEAFNAGELATAEAALERLDAVAANERAPRRAERAVLAYARAALFHRNDVKGAEPLYCRAAALAQDGFWYWMDCGRARLRVGSVTAALGPFEIAERLGRGRDDRAGLAAALAGIGEVAHLHGRLDEARAAYAEAVGLRRALSKEAPEDARRADELAASLRRLGDVELTRGAFDDALDAQREGLSIRRDLLERRPENDVRLQNVGVALDRIGDVWFARDDMRAALDAYRESAGIARRLADASPDDATRIRNLGVTLKKTGEVRLAERRADAALRDFEEAAAIARRLAGTAPRRALWQRDVAISSMDVGRAEAMRGDASAARRAYRKSLRVLRALRAHEPGNALLVRDITVGLWNLAGVDPMNAARHWAEIERLLETLEIRDALSPEDASLLAQARQRPRRDRRDRRRSGSPGRRAPALTRDDDAPLSKKGVSRCIPDACPSSSSLPAS